MRASGLVLLSMLLQGSMGLRTSSHTGKPKVPPTPYNDKVNPDGQPIFYTVIMGRLAYRHQVSLWLSSVQLVGKWKGEAVIVTDKPVCLSKTLEEAGLLGPMVSSSAAVDVYKSAGGQTGNIHLVKRPVTTSINKMKLEKARGWLNVKVAAIPHPVTSIIYTDEDVVIAKDLTAFVKVIRSLESQRHTLALFRDTGLSKGELHTGVVAMFPSKATDQCLQAWGRKLTHTEIGSAGVGFAKNRKFSDQDAEIAEDEVLAEEAEAMGPDQQALGGTHECKMAENHNGIKILPKPFFWLPTPGGLAKGREAEFVHFTNTGRWKRISKEVIRTYLTKIGIPKNIDPTGHVQSKECAIPEGGTMADVKKMPAPKGR